MTNKLKWREDSSNASTTYVRNNIRHNIIPSLKALNSNFLQNFISTQGHLQETQMLENDALNYFKNEAISQEQHQIKIDIDKLNTFSEHNAYLYAFLKQYNFTAWQDLYELIDAQSGKQVQSHSHNLLKDRNHLILSEIKAEISQHEIRINKDENTVDLSNGKLVFEEVSRLETSNKDTIYVDKDLLKYPLTVRHWQKGDYFYPFGMQGKKKLSKFFKDEKLTLNEKNSVQLLCSAEAIVWIINKRMDNRFKVIPSTKQILKITLL